MKEKGESKQEPGREQKQGEMHDRRKDKEVKSQQNYNIAEAVTISCTKATLILILISSNKNRIFSIFGTVRFI